MVSGAKDKRVGGMDLKHRLPAAIPTGLDQTEKEGMRGVCRESRQMKESKLSSECQK